MAALVHQRCANHALREAAARCLECSRFYCRECVTEHAERVVCASCLKKLAARPAYRQGRWRTAVCVLQCGAGVLVCWIFFYYLGRVLLAIPSSFHEGTVWKQAAEEAADQLP